MRAAGLVCLGAGAGLIRGDLRDARGTDVALPLRRRRRPGHGARPARCRCWPATTRPLLAAARFAGNGADLRRR